MASEDRRPYSFICSENGQTERGLTMLLPLRSAPTSITLPAAAGLIAVPGGLLIAAGLCTRVAALVCSAEMAMAWSALNLGDAAILFCVVFFYLVFAGPGPWSLDAVWSST